MIEEILLTVDNASSSQHAAEFVAQIARTYQSKVTVLHAYKPAPSSAFSSYFLGFGSDKATLKAKDLVKKSVKSLKRMGVEDVNGELMVGTPGEALIKAAKSYEPDLIVIGSRKDIIPGKPKRSRVATSDSGPKSVPVLFV